MTIRFLPLSLYMLGVLVFGSAYGQTNPYLWIKGEQVFLTEDPSRLSVILEQPQAIGDMWGEQTAAKHAHINLDAEIARDSHSSWLLFELPVEAGKAPVPATSWQQRLNLSGVKSLSYGYLTPDAAQIWLDHQVSYRPNARFEAERFEALLADFPGAQATATRTGIPYVELPQIDQAIAFANALYESGMVAFAQPAFRSPTTLNGPQDRQQINAPECPPADPHFADQFYLDNTVTTPFPTSTYPYFTPSVAGTDINVRPAWCLSTGNSGITVAVIDEGGEAHEDLEDGQGASRLIGGYYTDPANIGNGEPTQPADAHGQAILGIVGASHNNLGPSGVAPDVSLLAVHIDKANSTDLQRADGVEWAYKNGADIILNAWTYSFCSGFASQALEDAIDSAQTYGRGGLGSLVIFAAGFIFNDGDPTCVQYPANLTQVLTVGAIGPDADSQPPNYAPRGPELDMVAVSSFSRSEAFVSIIDRMGDLGYNTPSSSSEYSDRNYSRYFGGTSAAAATVAGAAALILDLRPLVSHTQLMDALTSTTVDVGTSGVDTNFGSGMLDVHAALVSAQTTFPVEWGAFRGEQVRDRIQLDWQTLSEVNNHRFEVQRQDAGQYVSIGQVAGFGTTSQSVSYTFVDPAPHIGTNLYRLKQVDLDGQEDLSRTLSVTFSPKGQDLIGPYPNPARERTQFRVIGQQGNSLSYRLLDIRGRVVTQESTKVQEEIATLSLSLSSLPPGLYHLEVRNETRTIARQRLIVQP